MSTENSASVWQNQERLNDFSRLQHREAYSLLMKGHVLRPAGMMRAKPHAHEAILPSLTPIALQPVCTFLPSSLGKSRADHGGEPTLLYVAESKLSMPMVDTPKAVLWT